MKCNKCNGEMTQLLTSFFCPKCEGGDSQCKSGNKCGDGCKDSAISKLDKDKKSDCDGCGGSCGGSAYPGGHSLHSLVKEDYILFGPITKISMYPPGGSHEFLFEYNDPDMVSGYNHMKRIIHKDDLLGVSIPRINALINSSTDGYTLYYQVTTQKFCIAGPGWSWNSKLGKWDYCTTS